MRALAITSCALALVGCAERVGPPVPAGLDSEDSEQAEYLADLHASAAELADSAAMRGRLGMAYHANGFVDAAAATYAQARALARDEFLWPYLGAFVLAAGGDLPEAVTLLDEAIEIDAGYLPAWLQRGTWLLDLDRLGEAATAFERAAALAPSGELAVIAKAGLARILLRDGRVDEAITALEPLLGETDHPQLHRLLGRAYRAAGRDRDAAVAAERGRDAPPFDWRDERRETTEVHVRGFHGRLALAETHLKRGNAHRATALLESLREIRPDDSTLINNLGIAYQRTGRPEQAADVLRSGLETHPGHALFHFNLASLHEDAGRLESAIEHFGRVIELDPVLPAAYERRAVLLMRTGQAAAARADLEALVPLGGAAAAFRHAAMVAGSRGRWAGAIELLERAVDLDSDFTMGHVFLGRALAEAGRYDAAREALARAAALGTHADEVAAARRRVAALDARAS